MALAILASILLASSPAAPLVPGATDAFAGCHGEANGPNGRFIGCPDWNATITAFVDRAWPRADDLATLRAGAGGALPGKVREESFTFNVDGHEVRALRLLPVEVSADFGLAEFVLVPAKGGAHLLSCVTRRDGEAARARCLKALDYLASRGSPDGVPIDTPLPLSPPVIRSHHLKVPAGCKLAASNEALGRIQCPTSMLAWTVIPKEMIPSLQQWLDTSLPAMTSSLGGGLAEERRACHVEGLEGTCAILTKDMINRGKVRLHVGVTVVENHGVMVSCLSFEAAGKYPPVCNDTIAIP